MVTLEDKIAFLSEPATYAGGASAVQVPVQVRETHMSLVFLAGERVLKIKKPVSYPFLDFSTLAARRRDCEEEIALNRRLAGDVYRRMVALRERKDGRLALSPPGRIVDWLVEMRRLPDADLLDHRLQAGRVAPEEIVAVAEKLARFYAGQPAERVDGHLYLEHLEVEMTVNRNILCHHAFGLSGVGEVLEEVGARYAAAKPEIAERIAGGQIVEGHGDLRPQHVFLAPEPLVIDCLEFSRAMRILDPYDELNYLGLECAMLGATWIRPLLMGSLEEHFGTPPSRELMGFYGAFRGVLRARLCLAHLLDAEPQDRGKWPRLARGYMAAAQKELRAPAPAAVGSSPRD